VRDFQAVLDTDPNNADALSILSNCYLISGRVDRARPLVERFSAVDPLNPLSQALRGYVDMLEGRSETAVAAYREMLEMDPSSPMARLFYGMNLVRAGQLDEAAAVLGGFGADVQGSLGARLGACLRAAVDGTIHDDLSKLADEFTRVGTISDMFARFLAWCYAQIGDAERAVCWLRVAADRGFINCPFLARARHLGGEDPGRSGLSGIFADGARALGAVQRVKMIWPAQSRRQPNVKANASTPASRNSISNRRSAIGFGCRMS
jgi:tetratricopeptide (TPR) repeat protein